MQTIRGRVDYKRPAAFKAPHPGERDPTSDPGLTAGHLYSDRARLMREHDLVWREYLRLFHTVKGIEAAIKIINQQSIRTEE